MTRRLPAPRWQTPLPPGIAGSWGPEVEAWAAAELGIVLDRWQRRALNRALAYGEDGRLLHRLYLISTARQNGKTAIVRALIGWALTGRMTPAWSRILGLAHDRKQARIPYVSMLEDLTRIRRRNARGGLVLTRYLGIRSDLYGRHREYDVGSRESRNAIRGSSNDLGIFDEIRTQTNYDTWAALEPTTRARPDPLILGLSTAGDDRSILLRGWWERGIRIIEGAEPFAGFGMTWYAASDDLAPDDPKAILAANPAVAEGRLAFTDVANSIHTLSPATYRTETLNLWAEGVDEWLPPGLWRARTAPEPSTGMRVVLGAEAVPTWRRVSVSVAIVTDSGTWVGVAGEIDSTRTSSSAVSPDDLVRLVARLVLQWRPTELAFSAAASAAPHLEAYCQANDLRPIALGPRQIRAASELFRSELVGARLAHGDDPLLAEQVAVARPSGPLEHGNWYLSVRESLGEIDALRACIWAAWAAISPETEPAPAIH